MNFKSYSTSHLSLHVARINCSRENATWNK